jgi:hypothetical protein
MVPAGDLGVGAGQASGEAIDVNDTSLSGDTGDRNTV